jgi:N-acetylglucosaminyl-diphospho-decaprenol L-rhamnosyltransferase
LSWLWNRFIEQSSRPFIALLNPDIVLSDGWSSEAIACMAAHADCGVVSPVTNNEFHSKKFGGIADLAFSPMDGKAIAGKLSGNPTPRFSIFKEFQAVPGHCFIIRKEAWKKVSGFDEKIPFAGNDYDFSNRVVRASMSLGVCLKAACYHKWNQSIIEGKALGTFNDRANCPKFSAPPKGASFSSI